MDSVPRIARQFLAVALLVASIVAAYGLVVSPAWQHFADARQQIAEQRILLGRFQEAAGRRAEAEEMLRNASAAPVTRLALRGETEAIQLAGLQSLVGEAASRRGVRLSTARPLPATDSGGLRLVGLRLDLRADFEAILSLLHDIEAMEPTLIVTGLQIRAAGGTSRGDGQDILTLDASISVYGAQPQRKG